MYTIQLRNIPEEVYNAVKKSAANSKRSMTKEVIIAIEKYLEGEETQKKVLNKKMVAFDRLIQLNSNNPLPLPPKEWYKEDLK